MPTTVTRTQASSIRLLRVLTYAALASIFNLLLFWIGVASGASMKVTAPQPVTALSVVLITIIPLVVMGGILWLLDRYFSLRRLAGWAGLVFSLVTIAGSLLSSADLGTALVLSAMHVVVGLAWFTALQTWAKTPALNAV